MAYDFSIGKYSEIAPNDAPAYGIAPEDRAALYDIAKDVIAGEYGNRVNIRQDDNSPISYDSLADTRGGREILDELKSIISHYPEGHFEHPSELTNAWDTVFQELCDAYDGILHDAALEVQEAREDAIARTEYNEMYPKESPHENNDVDMPWYLKSSNGIEISVREDFLNNIDNRAPEYNEATEKMLALRAEGKQEEGERVLYDTLLEKSDEYRAEHNLPPFERSDLDFSVDNGQRFNTYDEFKATGSIELSEERKFVNTNEGGTSMAIGETLNKIQNDISNDKGYETVSQKEFVDKAAAVFSEAFSNDEKAKQAIGEYVNGDITKSELIATLEQGSDTLDEVTVEQNDADKNAGEDISSESRYEQKYQEHAGWLAEDRGNVRLPRDVFQAYHRMGEVYNAYKGGIEINGKVPTVADVALSAVSFLQSNVLESLIVAAFRLAFDSFSSKDVEKNENEEQKDFVEKETYKDTEIKDSLGVHDDGYIETLSSQDSKEDIQEKANNSREISHEAGNYYGFDLTATSDRRSTDDCVIYNGDKKLSYVNRDNAEKITIPSMRYVELDGKRSVVDPFGKVVYDITGNNSKYLSGLDVSKSPKISEFLKSEAKSRNISVEELKTSISNDAREHHVEKIASSFKVEANSLSNQVDVLRAQSQDVSRSENVADFVGKIGSEVTGNEGIKERFESIKSEASDVRTSIETRISDLENRIQNLNTYANSIEKPGIDLETKEKIAYKSESEAVGRTIEIVSPYKDFVEKNGNAIEKGSDYVEKTVEVVNDLRKEQLGNDTQRVSLDRYDFQLTDRFGYTDNGVVSKGTLEAQGEGDLSIKEKILSGVEPVNVDTSDVVDMSEKELAEAFHDPMTTDINEFIADAKEAFENDPALLEKEENQLLNEIGAETNEFKDATAFVEASQQENIPETVNSVSQEELELKKADPIFGEDDDFEAGKVEGVETEEDDDEDDNVDNEAANGVEKEQEQESSNNDDVVNELNEKVEFDTEAIMPGSDLEDSLKNELSESIGEIFSFRIEDDEGRTAIDITSPYLENCEAKLEGIFEKIDSQITTGNFDEMPQIMAGSFVDAINNEIANNQALIDVVGGESLGEYIQDMGAHIMESIAENYGNDFASSVDAHVSEALSNNEVPEEFVPYVEGALEGAQFGEHVEIPLELSENIVIMDGSLIDAVTGDELFGFPSDEAAESAVTNVNVSLDENLPQIDITYKDVSADFDDNLDDIAVPPVIELDFLDDELEQPNFEIDSDDIIENEPLEEEYNEDVSVPNTEGNVEIASGEDDQGIEFGDNPASDMIDLYIEAIGD